MNRKEKKKVLRSVFRRFTAAVLSSVLLATMLPCTAFLAYAERKKPFEGFPVSYVPYLEALQKKYPDWEFVPDRTGIDYTEAVDEESKSGRSLVQLLKDTPKSWVSMEEGDFDAETNTWKVYDGTNWVAASRELVAYYLDPRNQLRIADNAESKSIFQFNDFSYHEGTETKEGLLLMLKGTFLEKDIIIGKPAELQEEPKPQDMPEVSLLDAAADGTDLPVLTPSSAPYPDDKFESAAAEEADTAAAAEEADAGAEAVDDDLEEDLTDRFLRAAAEAYYFENYVLSMEAEETDTVLLSAGEGSEQKETYADIIMEAAEIWNISPYVLAAFIIQEQGAHPDGDVSDLISGNHAKYPGIYNYLNCGAYNTATMDSKERGLWWAKGQDNNATTYGRPWDTPKKAILGGAQMLSEDYVSKGQNTIYYKRFNVNIPEGSGRVKYLHQYMTNIEGAWAEGWKTGKAYEDNGILKNKWTFHIPVYENMPEKACPKPAETPLALDWQKEQQEKKKGSETGGTGDSGSGTGGSPGSGSGGSSGGSGGSSGGRGSGGSGGGSSGGAAGGPGGSPAAGPKTSGGATFSKNWYQGADGNWRIKDQSGNVVRSAWLCDDAVTANGQNVWYLMNTDGTMLSAPLVQDNTGNFYSLETRHEGYYGMLRYVNGTYDGIYMEFSKQHDGTFGAVTNQSAIDALKAKYGVTHFGVDNSSCQYTRNF